MVRKPPKSYPQSLRFTPKAVSPLAVAAGRHQQAREEASKGEMPLHQVFLTRYVGLEALLQANRKKIFKELSMLQSKSDLADWEVLAHVVAALPPAMLKRIFALEEIAQLNVLFGKRPLRRILEGNQALREDRITWASFTMAKKDLRFQLGQNNYKSSLALGLYLYIIRCSCDPKISKKENFVNDIEVLEKANPILDYIAESVVQHHRLVVDRFKEAPHRNKFR